jgi:flavin reductase (DIM6/NTAB) family NADH-FMN oxidoreductase RutF
LSRASPPRQADKLAAHGLTLLESKEINAPGIAEAAVVLECRVIEEHRLPPCRCATAGPLHLGRPP